MLFRSPQGLHLQYLFLNQLSVSPNHLPRTLPGQTRLSLTRPLFNVPSASPQQSKPKRAGKMQSGHRHSPTQISEPWLAFGNTQLNNSTTAGTDTSSGSIAYSNTYSYPLFANSTAVATLDRNLTFFATLNRSKNLAITGSSIYPSSLQTFATLPKSSSLVAGFQEPI